VKVDKVRSSALAITRYSIRWRSPFRQHLADSHDSTSTFCQLKCYMSNVQSLCNKIADLHCFLDTENPDVLILTESWLDCSIPDSLLDANNSYHIF